MQRHKLIRYAMAVSLILAMVLASEILAEPEVIFPELVALTLGALVIDKQVWAASRVQIVLLLSLGSALGLCISRYSPMILPLNVGLAFAMGAGLLLAFRSTLNPTLSACILPVLLGTESWVYPLAVVVLSLALVGGQWLLERLGFRQTLRPKRTEEPWKTVALRWLGMLICVLTLSAIGYWLGFGQIVLPPLVVAFTEIVNSRAGFRNRPTQLFLTLTAAVTLGTGVQLLGTQVLQLPQIVVATGILALLLGLFALIGKPFAPAGALAFIPMIVPAEWLTWLPVQASVGAGILIATAMLAFLKCYRWDAGRLTVCLVPESWRRRRERRSQA